MPEQAQKANKPKEKKSQVEHKPANEGQEPVTLQDNLAVLLAMQQSAGNRAVNQFIRGNQRPTNRRAKRQMATSGVLAPGNASSGVIQLFRSGRVEPNIQFEEGPEDEVNIQLPYQIETLDEVLAIVDRVIQTFGSGRRSYVQDESFRTSLTRYLQTHQHPSMGGSSMNRVRNLAVRIRLIRGDGNHIERVEHTQLGRIEYVAAPPERGTEGANDVAVSIPYETGSLEEMLGIIDEQIQPFDPQCFEHVQNDEFQAQLRDYLISIDHPVVSEGATAHEGAALNLQVRLVYGPRGSVETLQLLAPPTRRPEGAEAPPEPVRRTQWGSFWIRVADAAEQRGRDVSGRVLFEILNRHMQNFSDEFVRVNESRNLHAEERFITPFIALSHLVLQMALSLVDLVAQANPENLMMITANRLARTLAGEYGLEEYQQDIRSALEFGWNLTPFAQFIAGWREVREGEANHNDYQIFHGLEVMVLSIGATYELGQGARGAYQSRRAARTGAITIPEGEGVLRGQGEGQIPIIEEPAQAVSARPEPVRIAAPEEAPRLSSSERPAAEAVGPAARPAETPAARPAETPAAGEAVERPAQSPAERPAEGAPAVEPPVLEYGVILRDVQHCRNVLRMYQDAGNPVFGLESAEFRRVWTERGGRGGPPPGFVDGNFDLVLNKDLIPEAPGLREMRNQRRQAAEAGAPRRVMTPEEETAAFRHYEFREALTETQARELLESWRRNELPPEYTRVVIPLERTWYLDEFRTYGGPEGAPPPGWVSQEGVLNLDIRRMGLPEETIQQVFQEYTSRSGSRRLSPSQAEAAPSEAPAASSAPAAEAAPAAAEPAAAPPAPMEQVGAPARPPAAERPAPVEERGAASESTEGRRAAAEEARTEEAAARPAEAEAIARPAEYTFVEDLEMARARELLDAWRRDELPAEYHRVVFPLNQDWFIRDYRAYLGPSEVAPPAWVGERGVLNFDLEGLGMSREMIDQVRSEYITRGGSRLVVRIGDWSRPPVWRVEVSAFSPEEAQAIYHDMRQAGNRVVEVDTSANMQRAWDDLGQTGDAPSAFIGSDEVLIVDMEAVQRAGGVPEIAAAGEAGGRAAPTPEITPAQASGPIRPAGNLPPDVELAARDFGMRRIYLPEDIALAREAMQDAISNGDRLTPVSARAMPGRWRLYMSVGETPLAFVMPDGDFIFNRDVLTRE